MQLVKRPSRTRVLTDQELAVVFKKARSFEFPLGHLIQLCILTGQRKTELASLRRSYIRDGQLTLPDFLTKNGVTHTLPLGPMALAVIEAIPDQGDLLFPSPRGATIFAGWYKLKDTFDEKLSDEGHDFDHWVLHDLRRTFRTGLGKLGVPPHVAERVVNHVTVQSDMERVYDHYKYLPEMRAAMQRWEAHITALLAERSEKQAA